MISSLAHRGPDGNGAYISGPIGSRPYPVVDHRFNDRAQPMSNEDKKVWVVYNGEIYNFPQLRRELLERGHRFQSTTDTEVIVHLYEEYGINAFPC